MKYKSFRSLGEAQAWLQGIADAAVPVPGNNANHALEPPRTQQGGPVPSAQHPQQQHHNVYGDDDDMYADTIDAVNDMEVDEDSSDIEILSQPPAGMLSTSYESDDDDIQILPGPPPNWYQPNKTRGSPQLQVAQAKVEDAPPHPAADGADEEPPQTAPEGMLVAGPVAQVELSPEQMFVLSKVRNGESVFFTGSAGTGKSVLLREIIKHFGGRPSKRLGVTASTGIASVNIGGCTLHSWAGIGLGKDDKDNLVGKIYGMARNTYKQDKKRRDDLWRKRADGKQLTDEELDFLSKKPEETRKSKILDRWRQVKTLIIDESV